MTKTVPQKTKESVRDWQLAFNSYLDDMKDFSSGKKRADLMKDVGKKLLLAKDYYYNGQLLLKPDEGISANTLMKYFPVVPKVKSDTYSIDFSERVECEKIIRLIKAFTIIMHQPIQWNTNAFDGIYPPVLVKGKFKDSKFDALKLKKSASQSDFENAPNKNSKTLSQENVTGNETIPFSETEKEKKADWRIFYYGENSEIKRGYIYIHANSYTLSGEKKKYKNSGIADFMVHSWEKNNAEPLWLLAKYVTNKKTVYYDLKRKNGKYPLSQMIFKLGEASHNIFIGTFCSAIHHQHETSGGQPYAGAIIAVRNIQEITPDLYALISYSLRRKRLREKVTSFEYSENGDLKIDKELIPARTKIWDKIKTYEGTYIAFFIDPYKAYFHRSYINIEKDGSIFLHTYSTTKDKPYKGAAKTIVKEGLENTLIINADFIPEADEYRIRIFANTSEFNHRQYSDDDEGIIKGTYSCLRHGTDKPFCSNFCMRLINPLKENEIINKLNPVLKTGDSSAVIDSHEKLHPIEKLALYKATNFKQLQQKLNKLKLADIFWPSKIDIKVDKESFLHHNTIYYP